MPIYEYKCPACGHGFERMMKLADPLPACPECGHHEVRKLISQTSFVLKGGGWYSDHYGLKSSTTKSEGGGSAEPAAAPAAPAPETKPAAGGS